MSQIILEKAAIVRKAYLGGGNIMFDLAPFPKTRFIKPGQFVHIRIPGGDVFFRRAFSVYDINPQEKLFRIIFKVVGRGTQALSRLKKKDEIDILGPLGNYFGLPSRQETVILAAGGIGMPPISFLAAKLVEAKFERKRILFFYGAASRDGLIEMAKIRKLRIALFPVTEDGSAGYKGLVTDAIKKELPKIRGKSRIYACGPEGMLKAVDQLARSLDIPGQMSLEAPMPCGIGVCLGCIRPLRAGGYTRVCRDGPVYDIGEVVL
jgi:dihydroorotate dehydrogenase electron transfer subunit